MESKTEKLKSACDVYYDMLSSHPKLKRDEVRGGINTGMSTSGNVVIVPQHGTTLTSYDEDTNRLLRAKFACQEDMVVSPLSTNKNTLFVRKECLEQHNERAKQLAQEKQPRLSSNGCMIQ